MNNVVKRAKEHVWYSYDAPLVQELLDEIERLQTKTASMGKAAKYMYDEMADRREALKAQRDELVTALNNAAAVAKQATDEVIQLRATIAAYRILTIKKEN